MVIRRTEEEKSPLTPLHKGGEGGVTETVPLTLNQITGYRDKMTYIFSKDGEVGCIHYDAMREDIFFNGHNTSGMQLNRKQWEVLEEFRDKLIHSRFGPVSYTKALDRLKREKRAEIGGIKITEGPEGTRVIETAIQKTEPAIPEPAKPAPVKESWNRQPQRPWPQWKKSLAKTIKGLDPAREYSLGEIARIAYPPYLSSESGEKLKFSTFYKNVRGLPWVRGLLRRKQIRIRQQDRADIIRAFTEAIGELDSQEQYSWAEIARRAYQKYVSSVPMEERKVCLATFGCYAKGKRRLPFLEKLVVEKGIRIRRWSVLDQSPCTLSL